MHATLTDEEMIRQYLSSQPNHCFEALYTRYVGKVYQQCLSITKDTEEAQDFTQDIFLKVFNKLGAFQQRSSFSTWLYAIAYNYCSDQMRLSKRLSFSTIDEDLEKQLAESKEAQLHEETLQLVDKAMETLSVTERTLLSLKYEQGMSIEEIAQLYNLKISAVKMRLKRSRAKMQQLCVQQYSI